MQKFDAKHQAAVIRQILILPEAPELLRSLLSDFTEEQKAEVKGLLFSYETDLVRRYLSAKDELTEFGRQTAARWSSDNFRDCVPDLKLPSRTPYTPPPPINAQEAKARLLANWNSDRLLYVWVMEFTASERAVTFPLLTTEQQEFFEKLESEL